jgi:N-acetylmuramoyl-L-alanine amidase
MLMTTAIMCMAMNVYMEARGEPIVGQHAVAQVTLNRAERDPRKVCEVVTKPKQFSWVNPGFGMVRKTSAGYALTVKGQPKDEKAWNTAWRVAVVTLARKSEPDYFVGGAKFYHVKTVRPVWRHSMKLVSTIGRHKFYVS